MPLFHFLLELNYFERSENLHITKNFASCVCLRNDKISTRSPANPPT